MKRVAALLMVLAAMVMFVPPAVTAQVTTSQHPISESPTNDGTAERPTSIMRRSQNSFSEPVGVADPVGVMESRSTASPTTPVLVPPQARDRGGIPYMVAGGILFVAGAIVGDDGGTLLMVGGAGVGAYGAYVYFGGD